MINKEKQKKSPVRKFTMLVFLVVFVFFVLLASIALAAGCLYMMTHFKLMKPVTGMRFPMLIFFLLMASLTISGILTAVIGSISLRPFKRFIDATKEIAAGNFDIRLDIRGPDELKRLAASFNEMAKELGSIETFRNDFVADISHEYKTPVASIRGFAGILKKGNLTKDKQDEYLSIIISEADRLTQMSSNVLLLSRLNSTEKMTDITNFSLDEQLRQAILLLNQQIEKKSIDLDIHLEKCMISFNQELLLQVWINLLSNAVKFTSEGGNIAVRLTVDDEQATVMVQDTGIGMDADVLKHAFDKFYQGDASHSSEGNGLGLALVKRIVMLCGGSVGADSKPEEGATFTVTLPKEGIG